MNLGNYTSKSLGLKIKTYFFDPLMIFWIYEKKFLTSRLRDKNYIFFILFSIELEFFVVITGIKWINFVVIVHIEIRTFLIMIFFKKTLFRGGIRDPTYLHRKTREIELVMILTCCRGILTSFFVNLFWPVKSVKANS